VLPGLMVHGQDALGDPGIRSALVATRYRSHRSILPAGPRTAATASNRSLRAAS